MSCVFCHILVVRTLCFTEIATVSLFSSVTSFVSFEIPVPGKYSAALVTRKPLVFLSPTTFSFSPFQQVGLLDVLVLGMGTLMITKMIPAFKFLLAEATLVNTK